MRASTADLVAGGTLVGGAVTMAAGAATGVFAPSLRNAPWSDDPEALAAAIAGNPTAWIWANSLFLVAAIITTVGLVLAVSGVSGRSRPWAGAAVVLFGFAAAAEVVDRVISAYVYTWAAEEGFSIATPAVASFVRFQDGLGNLFFLLGFSAVALFGVAISRRPDVAGLGWLFVAGGVLGLVLAFFGAVIPAMVYLETASLGVAVWVMPPGDADQSAHH